MRDIFLLLLLASSVASAQISFSSTTVRIENKNYRVAGDIMDLIGPARTGTTYPEAYPEISEDDVNSYIFAFYKDAALNGRLDELDGIEGVITLEPDTYWTTRGDISAGGAIPYGSARSVTQDGYLVRIRRSYHEQQNGYYPFGSSVSKNRLRRHYKIDNIYHELGHALLQLNHSCDTNHIMRGGSCLGPGYGAPIRAYIEPSSFMSRVTYMYNNQYLLPYATRTLN